MYPYRKGDRVNEYAPENEPDGPENAPEGGTGTSMPADPFSAIQASWVGFHEMYTGMRSGGFHWWEALFLLGANMTLGSVIAAGQAPQPPPEQDP